MLEKGTNKLKLIDVEFVCHVDNLSCVATGISQHYSSPNLLNATYNTLRKVKKYTDHSYMLKADVFSAGLVIYDLLMREPLLDSIHKFEKNPEKRELVVQLPDHLNSWRPLIEHMVRRNYIERLSSTEALNEFERIFPSKENNMDGGYLKKKRCVTRKKYRRRF